MTRPSPPPSVPSAWVLVIAEPMMVDGPSPLISTPNPLLCTTLVPTSSNAASPMSGFPGANAGSMIATPPAPLPAIALLGAKAGSMMPAGTALALPVSAGMNAGSMMACGAKAGSMMLAGLNAGSMIRFGMKAGSMIAAGSNAVSTAPVPSRSRRGATVKSGSLMTTLPTWLASTPAPSFTAMAQSSSARASPSTSCTPWPPLVPPMDSTFQTQTRRSESETPLPWMPAPLPPDTPRSVSAVVSPPVADPSPTICNATPSPPLTIDLPAPAPTTLTPACRLAAP